MIAEADYDALLVDLYAGATEPARLQRFLERLRLATGSHLTPLVVHDTVDPARNGFQGDVDAQLMARYEADFSAPDDKLWFQRSMAVMHTGAVLNGEDWASKAEIKHTRYYADFLREIDTAHSVALCALMSPTRSAVLTPCRSERAGPYGSQEMALFRQLAPHWANAYALMTRFEHLNAQVSQADGRQRALFLLDRELRWIGGNQTAERMVAAGWWRGHRGQRLDSPSAVTRAAWHAVQRQLAAGQVDRLRVIPVYDRLATLVAFASLQPYGAFAAGEGLPGHVLFVRPLQIADADDGIDDHLRGLFDLTAGEAALAVALRRHGELQQAAAMLGIAEGGARTRLQSIFEKTATHRQAELLRMLDALADSIA